MKSLITAALLLTALLTATANAVVIAGDNGYTATAYGNPFTTPTGSTNTTGVNSGGGTVSEGFPIANVVSQQDGANGGGTGRIQGATATNGFMQFVAASPFTAGTVITSQNVNSGFFSPMSYNILLDGNSVQSGAGAIGSSAIAVTTLASKQTVQTLRINEAMSTFGGSTGTHYADMNEVLILPDRLGVVPSTATATASSGTASKLDDLQGGQNYWFTSTTGSSVTLTFSGTKAIAALVLANTENGPNSTFNIFDSAGTQVAHGTLTDTPSVGEFVGIDFNTPVITSSLKFTFTNTGSNGMIEIIPLKAPEPASMGLLAVGGLTLLKRRRVAGR